MEIDYPVIGLDVGLMKGETTFSLNRLFRYDGHGMLQGIMYECLDMRFAFKGGYVHRGLDKRKD